MKNLRKKRILHVFSLGPGTQLHDVCICVCLLSYWPTACPVGPEGLALTAHKLTGSENKTKPT